MEVKGYFVKIVVCEDCELLWGGDAVKLYGVQIISFYLIT